MGRVLLTVVTVLAALTGCEGFSSALPARSRLAKSRPTMLLDALFGAPKSFPPDYSVLAGKKRHGREGCLRRVRAKGAGGRRARP